MHQKLPEAITLISGDLELSPALTRDQLNLFEVVAGSTPRPHTLRHSQLVCLLPAGILNLLLKFVSVVFLIGPEQP